MIIAFPHRPPNKGGPGSFQFRFENVLKKKGWKITYPDEMVSPDVVFVVGGTRKLSWLARQKIKGIPIIYRLDGINWLHRKLKVPIKKWLIDEVRNYIEQLIRSFLADHIIYQSHFVAEWWKNEGWPTKSNMSIIHNGIDLNQFRPSNNYSQSVSILCVEGNIDYSPYAIDLLNDLQKKLIEQTDYHSIILYGGFQNELNLEKLDDAIDYRGQVARDELPEIYNNAVYLSLDVNPACPNTVIEALASGIPVIGYDTGSLPELVTDSVGEVVPYGSDPWELNFPNTDNLCKAAVKVKKNWVTYSKNARKAAELKFNLEDVASRYLEIIESELNQ